MSDISFDLAFPKDDYSEAELLETYAMLLVPFDVSRELRFPISGVRSGIRSLATILVLVPEAAVNKYCNFPPGEH